MQEKEIRDKKKLHIDVHVHMISTREDCGAFIKRNVMQRASLRKLVDFRHKVPPLNDYLQKRFDDWYIRTLVKKIQISRHVDKVVLLAFDAVYHPDGKPDPDRTQACLPNDIVFEAAASHPELLAGASIHPYRSDAIEELERCAERGAVLIKWVPNVQCMDPSDKRITGFYEKMAELSMPLLSHTGYEHALRVFDQSLGDPRRLVLPLECGVTVIAAHTGASGIHDSIEYFPHFVDMLEQYPNLYGDLAALTWSDRKPYLKDIAKNMPHLFERMVHGSDYPVPVWPQFFSEELGVRRTLGMTLSRNYFDVEAQIKMATGMPESVLPRAATILRI